MLASAALQVFCAFTISAHNAIPWFKNGKPHPGRPDALILDAPVWHHWPQLLIWLPFQASILYFLFAWGDSKLPELVLSVAVLSRCITVMQHRRFYMQAWSCLGNLPRFFYE